MTNKKQRLEQVDMLKGIGILLVLLGHTVFPCKYFFYSFHMPLFFVCAGFFFRKKGIVQDIRQILIPWLFFAVFRLVTDIIIDYYGNGQNWDIILPNILTNLNPLDEHSRFLYHTLWFLVCLFGVKVIYRQISTFSMWIRICFIISGFLFSYFCSISGRNIPFFIDTMFCALCFYGIGYWFSQKGYLSYKTNFYLPVLLMLLFLIVCYIIKPVVEMKDNVFPCYFLPFALVPVWSLYQICFHLKERKYCGIHLLSLLGESSLFIFGFHRPAYDIVSFFMQNINLPMLFQILLPILFAVPFALALKFIFSRYAPILIGR